MNASKEKTISFDEPYGPTMAVGHTHENVAYLTFELDGLAWLKVSPEKLREIAKALDETASAVEVDA